MNILVLNSGSSSIKYQLFVMTTSTVLAGGIVEKIGESNSIHTYCTYDKGKVTDKKIYKEFLPDHATGFKKIISQLTNKQYGVIDDISLVKAVGHRVVHGGEDYHKPSIIDDCVIAAIRKNIPLAPLHNPANLLGIEIALALFPHVQQVAVFDTAFHQTIPAYAYIYAIPYEFYQKERIRRYGFHGTSHYYVAKKTATCLRQPLTKLSLITIHLGNGASMAAIKNGQCIDTTMGITPLEGLIMGTRSGDLDPGLVVFLANHCNMSIKDFDHLLNKQSGLKGICGTNDMREILKLYDQGDEMAKLALSMYIYRMKKYLGAFYAILQRPDAIVFTGGIGENAPLIREQVCQGLKDLGIEIDQKINQKKIITHDPWNISSTSSIVKIYVVPTNEELEIALQTYATIKKRKGNVAMKY